MVAINKKTDRAICHRGGVWMTMRAYITTGARKGTIDTQTTVGESGACITVDSMKTDRTNGITTTNWSCWPSCSVVVMAPMAAVINAPVEARITSKPPTLVRVVQISIRQE